jgi:hypothetical protein
MSENGMSLSQLPSTTGSLHFVSSFLYIDYIILDCLQETKLKQVAFTYGIYCKWEINTEKQARKHFPPKMSERFLAVQKCGFIPKLHIYGHGQSCQTKWSLNYAEGVGRTDGKSTERNWASVVLAGLQTAEMNPGSRHAALDDHWIDWNFWCLLGLSESLLQCQLLTYL